MKSVSVCAGQERYEVLIGPGLLEEVGALARQRLRGDRCAVVADTSVSALFAETVRASLGRAGVQAELVEVPQGENAKSIREAERVCARLSAAGLDRTSFLVSLGGGVVGDLAGFVASIYLRGIPFVAVPTTLLAQVDSCIGGKTGVNSTAGKNLIGSFHHPSLVVADIDTLRTLPDRIWNEGFAEAIKHGIIRDAALLSSLPEVDRGNCADFIARNLQIKAEIVSADEREQKSTRSLLNFGHTIGHAIEHAAGYGNMLHGEAVSLGMVAAAHVSVRRAGLAAGAVDQIRVALQSRQLPLTLPPGFPRERIFAALPRDKKFEQGRIRFVVAHEIGRASVADDVTMEDLHAAVDQL
ncbi:MAG: 3-dehydroquinate synthase [Spartobacteria bacterium]